MTLACGPYGPPFTTLHTEKEWPVKPKWRFIRPEHASFLLDLWSIEKHLPSNFYEAEWKEELDNYNEQISENLQWVIFKHQINQAFVEHKAEYCDKE